MRVWITKTQPPKLDRLERLKSWGYDPVWQPLLRHAPAETCPNPPSHTVSDLIFTSQNAVKYFAQYTDRRNFQIIAVGAATAQCARDHGFERVVSADGTARDIIHMITEFQDPSRAYYHGCGRDHRGDIVERLKEAGLDAERQILYETYAVNAETVKMPIMSDYIFLYSPKAARSLATQLRHDKKIGLAHIISISAATNEALGDMSSLSRHVAAAPTEKSMLELLPPHRKN